MLTKNKCFEKYVELYEGGESTITITIYSLGFCV